MEWIVSGIIVVAILFIIEKMNLENKTNEI